MITPTRLVRTAAFLVAIVSAASVTSGQGPSLAIGSKSDGESQILGTMLAQLARSAGAAASYRQIGGTQLVWEALVSGQIDAYPEYTGTLIHQILADRQLTSAAALGDALAERGLAISRPLGFNNTYAVAMKDTRAAQLGISAISGLAANPALRLGFSNEFIGREDGWRGLQARYGLPFSPLGYEHALLYGALESGTLDVIEVYSTDAQIGRLKLRVLEDDRGFFPRYEAVVLYRKASAERASAAFRAMLRLEQQIDETEMIALNRQLDEQRSAPAAVAAAFLERKLGVRVDSADTAPASVWANARQHFLLVASSMAAAIVVAVPLGIVSARYAAAGQVVLALVGVLQTVPSLALLVFMVPLLGLGAVPTIGALFLYSLLPMVRNTYAGLHDIPPHLAESAEALGLSPWARLRLIDLPMASRTILAGVKTAAVINVGTATVGGLIGAGGFGQPIVTGLALNDQSMILWQGAVPAAIFALVVQAAFDLAERVVVPAGLRQTPEARASAPR